MTANLLYYRTFLHFQSATCLFNITRLVFPLFPIFGCSFFVGRPQSFSTFLVSCAFLLFYVFLCSLTQTKSSFLRFIGRLDNHFFVFFHIVVCIVFLAQCINCLNLFAYKNMIYNENVALFGCKTKIVSLFLFDDFVWTCTCIERI